MRATKLSGSSAQSGQRALRQGDLTDRLRDASARVAGRFPRALGLYQLARHDFRAQAEHDYRAVFQTSARDLAALLPLPLAEAAILVLGCGYTYPDVILYASVARCAVGLDVLPAFYRDTPRSILRARHRSSAWPQLVRAIIFGRKYQGYYRWLQGAAGVSIRHADYALHSYDGQRFPFGDAQFDAVISNAALEHVADLAQTFSETCRVTRPGGIAYHLWHNFFSFSGGHAPDWLSQRHPWGHLRGRYAIPPGLYRRRPEEIAAIFARSFELLGSYQVDAHHRKRQVDEEFVWEGAAHLTGRVREDLQDYPEELLLAKSHLLIGRKRLG